MNGSITFDGSLVGDISGGGGGGDEVVITPVVTSGTKIADVSVNGVEKDLYCPTPTEVDITPVVTSGTKIADVSVNGVEKDLYCPTPPTPTEVDITPVVTSGTKIADVSIGGVEKDLYAPDYGADITALDGRLDTTEDNITSLTGRVGTAEGNITGLTTRMGTAESNITGLTNRMGAAEGNITNLSGRMTEAENDITTLGIECDAIAADLAAPYNVEETYSVGDYCTHDKVLYKCNTDISTPEEWDVSHWDAVKVTEDISEINSALSQLDIDLTNTIAKLIPFTKNHTNIDLNTQRAEAKILSGNNWVNGASTNYSIVLIFPNPNADYVLQIQLINNWNGSFKIAARHSKSSSEWGAWQTVFNY